MLAGVRLVFRTCSLYPARQSKGDLQSSWVMTEKLTIEILRNQINELPVSSAGRRQFSTKLKSAAIDLFVAKKAEGWTQARFAAELGINQAMLSYWRRRAQEAIDVGTDKLRPVSLVEDTSESATSVRALVLPNGMRVEGLSMNELVVMMRELKC